MLERMCADLRSASGTTIYADTSIKTALGAIERIMGMAKPMMDEVRNEPPRAMELVTVLLVREAIEGLNAYQLAERPANSRAETISFILGRFLRQAGYFPPN